MSDGISFHAKNDDFGIEICAGLSFALILVSSSIKSNRSKELMMAYDIGDAHFETVLIGLAKFMDFFCPGKALILSRIGIGRNICLMSIY